jgi:hypothetical protein
MTFKELRVSAIARLFNKLLEVFGEPCRRVGRDFLSSILIGQEVHRAREGALGGLFAVPLDRDFSPS